MVDANFVHKSGAKFNKNEHETPEMPRAMPRNAPRFYLITPPISDWTPYPLLFETATAACDVACVLLRTAAHGNGEKEKIVCALAPLVQKHGVACLVADDPQWAVRANADGVHIDGTGERLQSALRALKPGHIVGAGGLTTRDAAMAAAEAGADYLMFGGGAETHAQIVERVAWWAEIFNVPCVGYAHNLGVIGDIVRAGADFIALSDAVFADPRGAAAALGDAARLMAPTPEAAA
jgi:thiamine-phosphate pyrophosphorylase